MANFHAWACILAALIVVGCSATNPSPEDPASEASAQPTGVSFDGLEPLPDGRFARTYIDPTVDFRAYDSVLMLEPGVAFDNNWARNQRVNRNNRIRQRDIDRIRRDVAQIFRDVFTEELESAGATMVEQPGENVLILRPAILDLYVTAPDTMTAGRSRTFTAEAGRMTLYFELFDSLSGDIVARAADAQRARRSGTFEITNRVTNSAEARRIMRNWARVLADAYREVHAYSPQS